MGNTQKFSYHDKRVTLHLAMLSKCCREIANLGEALDALPAVEWDVYALPQRAQEVIFAEFDEGLEEQIKAEFVADPTFLIDYGDAIHRCVLCGHEHTRYEFRIDNIAGGQGVCCGSKCILTHGISVKGTETAEHARKALEATLRRHLRKLQIEAWHKVTNFHVGLFDTLNVSLGNIYHDHSLPFKIKNSARCKMLYDLPKLVKFYHRAGWLNTAKRWFDWCRLCRFALKFDEHCPSLGTLKSFEELNPKKATKSKKAGGDVELSEAPPPELEPMSEDVETIIQAATAMAAEMEAEVEVWNPEDIEGLPEAPKPKPDPVQTPYNDLVKELVFG